MSRNPYAVALFSGAGFLLTLAFMLAIVISEMTDYTSYDTLGVATLQGWVFVLVGTAGTAMIGALVIGGVARSIRQLDAARHAESPPSRSSRDSQR